MTHRLKQLAGALLLPALLPIQLLTMLFHLRAGRLRAARARGDRGAISIELALAIVALVVISIGVVAALTSLAGRVETKVNNQVPAGQ
ncbi:hypothetical protein [Kitasatospora sp. NPDC050543]|uniref:hypothetical protein n=1 Tax=Kitasatospora sp. NPDC050543 TaxID=3364054 RepID=UPI00378F7E82